MREMPISWEAFLLFSLSLLILPLKWVFSVLLAAAFHEAMHIGACRMFGIRIRLGSLSSSAFILNAPDLSWWQFVLCSLAGPLGSLFLTLFIHSWPELAIAGLVQGVYNLLPLYPLDGGRILYTLLTHFLGEIRGIRIQKILQIIIQILLCGAILYAAVTTHISGILFALIPLMNENFPGNTCVKGKEML